MMVNNRYLSLTLLAACLGVTSCAERVPDWSSPKTQPDGTASHVATLGLALSLGPSGRIEMIFGSMASGMGDDTPEVNADMNSAGDIPVGDWVLSKGNSRVTLPRDQHGTVRTYGLYENTDAAVWQLLSSPGCATLVTREQALAGSGDGSIVEKSYRLCNVDRAAQLLRKTAARSA